MKKRFAFFDFPQLARNPSRTVGTDFEKTGGERTSYQNISLPGRCTMAGGTGRVFLPGEHVRFRLETHDEEDKSVSSTVEYGVVHSIEQGGSEGELSYTMHMYNHEYVEFEDPAASDGSTIGPLTLKEQIDQGIQPIDIVPNVTIVYEYEIDDSDSDRDFGEEGGERQNDNSGSTEATAAAATTNSPSAGVASANVVSLSTNNTAKHGGRSKGVGTYRWAINNREVTALRHWSNSKVHVAKHTVGMTISEASQAAFKSLSQVPYMASGEGEAPFSSSILKNHMTKIRRNFMGKYTGQGTNLSGDSGHMSDVDVLLKTMLEEETKAAEEKAAGKEQEKQKQEEMKVHSLSFGCKELNGEDVVVVRTKPSSASASSAGAAAAVAAAASATCKAGAAESTPSSSSSSSSTPTATAAGTKRKAPPSAAEVTHGAGSSPEDAIDLEGLLQEMRKTAKEKKEESEARDKRKKTESEARDRRDAGFQSALLELMAKHLANNGDNGNSH